MRFLSLFALGAVAAVAEDRVLDDIIRSLQSNGTNSSSSASTSTSNQTQGGGGGNVTSAPTSAVTSAPTSGNATQTSAPTSAVTSAPTSTGSSAVTSAPTSTGTSAVTSSPTSAGTSAATSAPATETSAPASNVSLNGTTAAPGTQTVTVATEMTVGVLSDAQAETLANQLAQDVGKKMIEEALGTTNFPALVPKPDCAAKCKCKMSDTTQSVVADVNVCFEDASRRRTSEVRKLATAQKKMTVTVVIKELSAAAATDAETKITAAVTSGNLQKSKLTTLVETAAATASINVTVQITTEPGAIIDTTASTPATSNAFAMVSAGFGVLIAALLF